MAKQAIPSAPRHVAHSQRQLHGGRRISGSHVPAPSMAHPRLTSPAPGRAAAALGPCPRFVHLDLTPAELLTVEAVDGVSGGLLVSHLDKAKPSWATRVAIRDERDLVHLAVAAEKLFDFRFARFKR